MTSDMSITMANRLSASDAVHARQRDHFKAIAETTLESIQEGSVNIAGVSLDLAAKVRFSDYNTRYCPPDDHFLSGWTLNVPNLSPTTTEISILEISTLHGASLLHDTSSRSTSFGRIAVLNFASPIHPGGRFLAGSPSQEESIARSSTLYHSLMTNTAQQFYKLHLHDRRGGFYHHAMIYTPAVVVFRDDAGAWVTPFEVDILTCAAVNAGQVQKEIGGRADRAKVEREIEVVMKERMARILCLMELQGAKNLVLGSFGTGAFRNSVEMVARIWADLLRTEGARYRYSFDRIVFAILDTSTFSTFKRSFEKACDTTNMHVHP